MTYSPRLSIPSRLAGWKPSWEGALFLLGAWFCTASIMGTTAHGQSREETPSQYVRTQWTTEDGLPVNSVNDIAQTPEGYLWLATYDGLVRFDGQDFRVYRSGQHEGLPSSRITNLRVRPDGIWMRTESWHLVRFQDGTFTTVAEELDTFHEGADDTLWMGNDKGAWIWRDGTFEIVAEGDVQHLLREADGTLWIATGSNELYRRSPEDSTREAVNVDGAIHDLSWDRKGRVWIGTQAGLYRWSGDRLTMLPVQERLAKKGSASVSILGVAPDVGGQCLASTSEGIFRCEEDRLTPIIRTPLSGMAGHQIATRGPGGSTWIKAGTGVYLDETKILESERTINSLFSDREDNVWVGTNGDGLFRLRRSPFVMYGTPEGLSSSNIYPIEQRQGGSVWLGTLGGGLSRIGPQGDVETYRLSKNGSEFTNVWSLHEDRSGRLWVSGVNARVCQFRKGRCARPGAESPIRARIRAFHEDRRGRLWAGSERGGLYRCDSNCLSGPDAWAQYAPSESSLASPEARRVQNASVTRLPHPYVRTIHETPDGTLWVGTNGGGIARYKNGTFTPLTTAAGLSSNLVRDIYQDTTEAGDSSVLWVATEDQGLNRIQLSPSDTTLVDSVTVYRKRDGLYDNAIHQILKDDQGRFWISSNRGLFWVRTAELEAFARGEISRIHSISYTTKEGLRSREANGGVQPAGLKAQDGRLWFPTQKGAAVVDPATISTDLAPPPVYIETVTSGDSTVARRPEASLRLAAEQRNFEVRYTGIRLSNPESVSFRYRLKGLQDDWKMAGERRRAFFTNVPPGTYTFEVAAQARGKHWSAPPAQLTVTVAPYFYETWWFSGLFIFLLGAIGYGGIQYRLYTLQRRQERLEETVAERTRELQTTSAQLEALFERSPDMVKIHDAEGTVLRTNPRYFEELGYREEELIGMKIWELDPSISPQKASKLWAEMEIGDRHRFESILRCKDGSTFPVEVHIRRLRLDGDDRFMAISRDITERKEAERELERENERLDRFASVLSHDLRNPLNVAQGRLQLAREQNGTDPEGHLSSTERALGRMDEIIEDMLLLTWSKREISPEDLEAVALEAAARKAWDNVEAPEATFEVASSARPTGHEGRLRRLLENLFRNAVEHGGKAITVRIGALEDGFFVEDDGPGIPEGKRETVLESGYSSQEEGTGLGLSIVKTIAEAHEWGISVTESREGGARFEFRGVDTLEG